MKRRWALGLGGAAALVAGLVGCPDFAPDDVCGYPGFCGDSSVTEGGKDGGSDGPVACPPGCELSKDPKDSPACVASSVGVFVDSTKSDSNNGAKETPVATVGKGLALAKQNGLPRIYVCEGTYAEDLVIDASHDGISIYGGWKCADWSYSGGKPVIGKTTTASKLDALTQGTTIEDVAIAAPDATSAGESSLAMFVNGSQNVALSRVALSAGVGVKGADGTLTTYTFPASLDGNNANGDDGGAPKSVNCPAGDVTVGGKGGDVAANRNGDNGQPALGGGDGGTGGSGSCTNGGVGLTGANGDAGAGAATNGAVETAVGPVCGRFRSGRRCGPRRRWRRRELCLVFSAWRWRLRGRRRLRRRGRWRGKGRRLEFWSRCGEQRGHRCGEYDRHEERGRRRQGHRRAGR